MRSALNDMVNQRPRVFVLLTLILPLVQGIKYLLIGSLYPMLIIAVFLSPVFCYLFIQRKYYRKTLKYWGLLNLAYGCMCILLFGLSMAAGKGVPSSIYYQFNAWYLLKTTIILLSGILLLKVRKVYY